MSIRAGDSAYALLTNGTTIEIRPARPSELDAVRDMHVGMSSDNLYLRFSAWARPWRAGGGAGYAANPGRTARRCSPCWTAR